MAQSADGRRRLQARHRSPEAGSSPVRGSVVPETVQGQEHFQRCAPRHVRAKLTGWIVAHLVKREEVRARSDPVEERRRALSRASNPINYKLVNEAAADSRLIVVSGLPVGPSASAAEVLRRAMPAECCVDGRLAPGFSMADVSMPAKSRHRVLLCAPTRKRAQAVLPLLRRELPQGATARMEPERSTAERRMKAWLHKVSCVETLGARVAAEAQRAAARSVEFDIAQLAAFGETLFEEAAKEAWQELEAMYGSFSGNIAIDESPAVGINHGSVPHGTTSVSTCDSARSHTDTWIDSYDDQELSNFPSSPPSRYDSVSPQGEEEVVTDITVDAVDTALDTASRRRSTRRYPRRRRSHRSRTSQSSDSGTDSDTDTSSDGPGSTAMGETSSIAGFTLSPTAGTPGIDGVAAPVLLSTSSIAFDHSAATGDGSRLSRTLRAVISRHDSVDVEVDVLAAEPRIFTAGQCGVAAVCTALQVFNISPREARTLLIAQHPSDVYNEALAAQLAALDARVSSGEITEATFDRCIVAAEKAAEETAIDLQRRVMAEDLQPDSVLQLMDVLGQRVVYVLNARPSPSSSRPLVREVARKPQRVLRSQSCMTLLEKVARAAFQLDGVAWRGKVVLSSIITLERGHYWAFLNHPKVPQAWLLIDTMVRNGDERVTLILPDALATRVTHADAVYIMGDDGEGHAVGHRRHRRAISATLPTSQPNLASQVSAMVNEAADRAGGREGDEEGGDGEELEKGE